MQIATEAAVDIRDFYQPGADPAGAEGRDVLVLSIDATGVNMIPADLREPPAPRPAGPLRPSAQLTALVTAAPDPPRRAGALSPILHAMLRREPAKRPSVGEVRQHLTRIAATER